MRRHLPAIGVALASAAGAAGHPAADAPPPAFPSQVLDNGRVRMTLHLPDAEAGFYRGPRFDWSGMIARVEAAGHVYYGPWKTPHDPAGNDCAIGPAEEFGMTRPVGYDEAEPGGLFPKIGVGLLAKESASDPSKKAAYGFWKPYVIARPGVWRVAVDPGAIVFEQSLAAPGGYGYRYAKRIVLVPGADAFVIERRLENTGTRPIVTDHYNHNFTVIDGTPVGPDYRVVYGVAPGPGTGDPPAFAVEAKKPHSLGGFAEVRGRELVFTAALPPGRAIHAHLLGFPAAMPYAFAIENRKTGASVRVRGERPPARAAIYAVCSAVCPEPFIDIDLAPGAVLAWRTEYVLESRAPAGAAIR